ncbi:SDR family NAD(P)-dependent oxidoreductase [Paenarthrobacter sp. NPDC092416]|uniref:SDR family NAD(P)-dependent oxidoreductase n=1 Tax=Paenarthrobacter sp. NPDC092416 TaxID=3364386 RepID=UPI003816F201
MNHQRFTGKTAIVTGAGRGIGRDTALLLAREGANVVVNDLGGSPNGGGSNASIAQQVVDEIRAAGGQAVAEGSSVDSMAGGKAVVEVAMDTFGGIDILVNNAGIIRPARIDRMSEQDFDQVLAVNLKGYFATINQAAPHLMQCGGSIVNLSSPSGIGHYGMGNYSAAKEGVVGLSRTVARDLGEFGVRSNVVRPSTANSNMATPENMASLGYAVDSLGIPPLANMWMDGGGAPYAADPHSSHAAAAIAWLCTDQARAINGRELFIAGCHIAFYQESELIRSRFHRDGWDLDSLCNDATTTALTWDQRNLFDGSLANADFSSADAGLK